MQDYVVNRPEEGALNRILAANPSNAAGTILRLAWKAGLLREEIQRLTWAQIDFLDKKIVLPDRSVPLPEDLADWLEDLREARNRRSETVVLSDRDQKPLTPQSISRLARMALDKEGQTSIRLIDLRHDFILRQLEDHDWQYVSRITGVEAAALNVHFAEHLEEKKVSTRIRRDTPPRIDEFALWKLLQAERTTPAGVTLWLTWQQGLYLGEIVSLRWEDVDFDRELLRLPDRTLPIAAGVLTVLRDLHQTATASPYVVTAPRSGQPYDRTRITKVVRAVLIKAGLDDVTLRDLRMDCAIRVGGENQVTAYLRKHASVTRAEATALMGVSRTTAYNRLRQMVQRGRLSKVGNRYYLPEAVVPPEEQRAVVLDFISREGFAYRQDVARVLHIEPRQCRPILQRLIAQGDLIQEGQRYLLPPAADGSGR